MSSFAIVASSPDGSCRSLNFPLSSASSWVQTAAESPFSCSRVLSITAAIQSTSLDIAMLQASTRHAATHQMVASTGEVVMKATADQSTGTSYSPDYPPSAFFAHDLFWL